MNEGSARYGAPLAAGIVLGVLALGFARLAFAPPEPSVHYHANFAIFLDDERMDLSADRYMQDVSACQADPTRVLPEQRVHLHNNDPDVVHVHHGGATWGHLLTNLGFGLGDDYLVTDSGERYESTPQRRLTFVINGLEVPSVNNRLIAPGDRLLIRYGAESPDELIETQFSQIASNADEFDVLSDPGTCAGQEEETVGERLRRAFWW